jgi:hypothetical protein
VADCEAVAKIQKLVDDIVFHRDITAVTTLSVSFFISLFSFEYRCSILNGARGMAHSVAVVIRLDFGRRLFWPHGGDVARLGKRGGDPHVQ